jgi:hypothetical protein
LTPWLPGLRWVVLHVVCSLLHSVVNSARACESFTWFVFGGELMFSSLYLMVAGF